MFSTHLLKCATLYKEVFHQLPTAKMEIFCGYFDTQGFYIDGVFQPVEVCFITAKETLHTLVKKNCSCSPSIEEKKSIYYLTKKYHGLKLSNSGIDIKSLRYIIRKMYNKAICRTSAYVACKSKEAEDLLDPFGIENMNLNSMGRDFKDINTRTRPCSFHKQL